MPPIELVKLYNRFALMLVCKTKRLASLGPTADKVAAWLEEQKYPLGPYLVACFTRAHWARQPALSSLVGPGYAKYYEGHTVESALRWRDLDSEVCAVSLGKEVIKQRMLAEGGPDFCRAQPRLTGGFNAASPICQHCPGREPCRRG
jgi:hypothetical protein